MKLPPTPLLLLLLSAILAPILGGQLSLEATPLTAGFSAWTQGLMGPEAPASGHFVIALPILVAVMSVFWSRRVFPTPSGFAPLLLLVFVGLLAVSVAGSEYKFVSFRSLVEWVAYAVAYFGAIAIAGRSDGPKLVAGSVGAGCTVVALLGITEYLGARNQDPSWRIFSTWLNANALAGVLLIGLFLLIGLAIASSSKKGQLSASICAGIVATALFLTQSKGGLLALGVGLAIAVVYAVFALGKSATRIAMPVIATVAVAGVLIGGLVATSPKIGGSGLGSRLSQSSETATQSGTFRKLLWQTSLALAKTNPKGSGIGTFRFESGRPGIIEPAVLAHNSYLQLLAETSIAGLVAFVAFLILAGREFLRGFRKLDPKLAGLRIGILGAIAATLAQNMVDSNLYHFGIGFLFFLLVGIAMNLSADAITPEYLPRFVRHFVPISAVLAACMMAYFAYSEVGLNRVREQISSGQVDEARNSLQGMTSYAGADGVVWSQLALLAKSRDERIQFWQKAIGCQPISRFYRALAREEAALGKYSSALDTLRQALLRDPRSFKTLWQIIETAKSAEDDATLQHYAKWLIDTESTPFFTVRAIPEIIPTETFRARILLSQFEQDAKRKAEMLLPAINGLAQYANVTAPQVVRALETKTPELAPDSPSEALQYLNEGISAAEEAKKLFDQLGRKADSELVDARLSELRSAVGALESFR